MAPLPADSAPSPSHQPSSPPSKTHKRKHSSKPTPPHILHTATFRRPLFTTLHIRLLSASSTASTTLDPLRVSSLVTSALTSYLGTTGAAIPIDILRVDGADAWIRVPRVDGRAIKAGLGGWVGKGNVGWRVVDEEGGGDLFGG